ncbi:hypothetical protein CFE70_007263 [Pyrenophora teres f. teres 0-1]
MLCIRILATAVYHLLYHNLHPLLLSAVPAASGEASLPTPGSQRLVVAMMRATTAVPCRTGSPVVNVCGLGVIGEELFSGTMRYRGPGQGSNSTLANALYCGTFGHTTIRFATPNPCLWPVCGPSAAIDERLAPKRTPGDRRNRRRETGDGRCKAHVAPVGPMRVHVGAAGHVKLPTHHLREPSRATNGSAAQRSASCARRRRRRLVYSAFEYTDFDAASHAICGHPRTA